MEDEEEEEEVLDGEEGQEKVVGEEEEAGGIEAGGWEGLRWSVRRAGDKDASVSAILDDRDCGERERFSETRDPTEARCACVRVCAPPLLSQLVGV